MIRLAIIFFLLFIIESESFQFNLEELNKLRQLFNDSDRRMEEATRGQRKNAAIVIGNGRGGKSTLINYIMGNELEANRPHTFENIKITKANNNIKGPEIGAGSLSTTTIPTKWSSTRPELQNLDIWDTAGFADNRGVMQDFNNSFHLYHLTRKVENLKLILVISFNEIINDNVEQVRKLLSSLEEYFTIYRFRTFFPSISVIISKAPKSDDYDNLVDHEYITDILFDRLLSNPKMDISEDSKQFVQNIIKNNNRLAFFKKAQQTGIVTSDIDVNIIPAINNCKRIIKSCRQDMGFTFSPQSKSSLKNHTGTLDINEITDFGKILCNSFDEKFAASCQSKDTNTLQTNKADLNRIYESLNPLSNNPDPEVKIQTLEMISDNLKNFNKENDVANKISLTKFIDFILKEDKMLDVIKLVNSLFTSVKVKIESLFTSCSYKLNEITKDEYDKENATNAENSKKIVNNLNDYIIKRVIPSDKKSGWRRFLDVLTTFLKMEVSTSIVYLNRL